MNNNIKEITNKKKMSINRITSKLGNFCIYGFLFLTTYIFLFCYNHSVFILRFCFLITGALIGYIKCFIDNKKFYYPLFFMLIATILWVLTVLGQGTYQNYSKENFLYTICYMGIAVLILNNEYNHIISLGMYGFTASCILVRIFHGVEKDKILLANSHNFISVLLLSTMLLYYISCNDKKKTILITPAFIFLGINMYATGRSGIIVSVFLVLSLLIYKYSTNKQAKYWICFVILFFLSFFAIFIIQPNDTMLLFRQYFSGFFQRGLNSNGRSKIWISFISNNFETVRKVFFGSDVLESFSDGNMHNMFFQAYASFGLIGFIALIILIINTIYIGLKKKQYLWIIMFSCLILRALTDRIFFQGYCELYLYYFVYYFAYHKKEKKI